MEEMERYLEEGKLALEEEERKKEVSSLNAKLSKLAKWCVCWSVKVRSQN